MDMVMGKDAAGVPLSDYVTRKVLSHGGGLMLVQFDMQPGGEAPPHSHPHEQVSYVVSGRFEYTRGDEEKRILGPGDSMYFAPDVPHAAKCLEEGVALDVFTPVREDFLTVDP